MCIYIYACFVAARRKKAEYNLYFMVEKLKHYFHSIVYGKD